VAYLYSMKPFPVLQQFGEGRFKVNIRLDIDMDACRNNFPHQLRIEADVKRTDPHQFQGGIHLPDFHREYMVVQISDFFPAHPREIKDSTIEPFIFSYVIQDMALYQMESFFYQMPR